MAKRSMDWEQRTLINELTQGKEHAQQLWKHLNRSSPQAQPIPDFLVNKILSSYDKAISLLNYGGQTTTKPPTATTGGGATVSGAGGCSPSPRSEVSEIDQQCQKDVSKKRKTTMPRWTEQVRVCSGTRTGLEGPLDDGYSWRKYGQKDILGANFPRGYYRCTHRHAQGCLATKQVQKSDQDPTILEITYRGRHTCVQSSRSAAARCSKATEKPKEEPQEEDQTVVMNFGAGLKVETEDLDNIFPSFSFPCASSIGLDDIFTETAMDDGLMGGYSPAFLSPATSGSDYFSVSPCHVNSGFGIGFNVQNSDSDFTEIVSAATSVTNSPIGDLDFSIDQVNFDANFPFDNLEFFS